MRVKSSNHDEGIKEYFERDFKSEVDVCELICIHIVGMGTFGLHELILCVYEDLLLLIICVHNEGMGTFGLHGLILCAS